MNKRLAAVLAGGLILFTLGLGFSAPAFAHGGKGGGGGGTPIALVGANCTNVNNVCDFPAANVGQAYSAVFEGSGGSGTPYTFKVVAGSLPPGISCCTIGDEGDGQIQGTPTKEGTFAFTVQIEDPARDTAQANFSVTVGPPLPLVISGPACCGSGDVGTAFLYDLIASGGVQPYTWSVTGTLPPGIKFSLSPTPNFSGTPTATGTFPLTIEVTDSTGTQASQSGSIVISPAGTPPPPAPLQIVAPGAGTPDDVGTVGESFDETLEASGGVTPYSWAITGLPPGLSITPGPSEESEISGTPTTAGTYSFTITVTDSTGTKASETSGIIIQS
jgi:large repetitive protein